MLESWIQYTCDGCGDTEGYPHPNATRADVRESLKAGGWRSHGVLDHFPKCVKNGNASRRETDMNH